MSFARHSMLLCWRTCSISSHPLRRPLLGGWLLLKTSGVSGSLSSTTLLAGGGYTCYRADAKTDDGGNPALASGIVVTSNVFCEKYYPTVRFYGPGRSYDSAGGAQWTNTTCAYMRIVR
jgi:hypothetical protein